MKMYKKLANKNNYDFGYIRPRKNIKGIVIHYTGNDGDTAKNNVDYFARENVGVSAHFFVDRNGAIGRSLPMNRVAWAVGVLYNKHVAKYWSVLNNYNTVSIELCGSVAKYPTKAQIKAVKKLVKYIRKYCKNAKTIVRHYDVCGKDCPHNLITSEKWQKFKKAIQ